MHGAVGRSPLKGKRIQRLKPFIGMELSIVTSLMKGN